MGDYIDKEELIAGKLEKMIESFGIDFQEKDVVFSLDEIKAAPKADVKEVVHARWISCKEADPPTTYKGNHYYCSNCNAVSRPRTPYCWKCGATMDLCYLCGAKWKAWDETWIHINSN